MPTRPSTRPPRPPKVNQNVERREISIDALLGAALQLFVSQGYRATNLEAISSAAGLTKGAIYFYFGSKEVVLLEVLKRVEIIVVDRAQAAVEGAGANPVDQFVTYIHYQASLGITHRDEVLLLILMSLEWKEKDGEVKDFISALYKRQRKLIDGLVARGQKVGAFRGDVPARELAAIVLATHDGTFLEWFRRSEALDGKALTRALRSVLLTGTESAPASSVREPPLRRAVRSRLA